MAHVKPRFWAGVRTVVYAKKKTIASCLQLAAFHLFSCAVLTYEGGNGQRVAPA